jgi:CheY-like chemotaxis protein
MPSKDLTAFARVLYVEDETDAQEVIAGFLARKNVECIVADSGEQAMEICQEQQFDMVIIDLALPGMDGWQLLENLRQEPSTTNLPAVVLTAYYSPEVVAKAQQVGFCMWFAKPVDNEHFVSELINGIAYFRDNQ